MICKKKLKKKTQNKPPMTTIPSFLFQLFQFPFVKLFLFEYAYECEKMFVHMKHHSPHP